MQTATVLLALAGDTGNSIQRSGVTPAEVAVLRVIHGDDSVSEIEITGDIATTDRAERARLSEKYGRQNEGRWASPVVDSLFPGVAARVFATFDELDLPEEMFKAERPARAPKPVQKTKAPAKETKGAKAKAATVEAAADADGETGEADEDDGIGAMPDHDLYQ